MKTSERGNKKDTLLLRSTRVYSGAIRGTNHGGFTVIKESLVFYATLSTLCAVMYAVEVLIKWM